MMSQSFPPKALIYSTRHIKSCLCSIIFICILIYSPPVWDGVCGTGFEATWHPAAPFPAAACPGQAPGCRNFLRLKYHYHPPFHQSVLDRLQTSTNCQRQEAAHTFPSSITIPCFICWLPFLCTCCHNCRQVFHREVHFLDYPDSISPKYVEYFVPLKIPFLTSQCITILI